MSFNPEAPSFFPKKKHIGYAISPGICLGCFIYRCAYTADLRGFRTTCPECQDLAEIETMGRCLVTGCPNQRGVDRVICLRCETEGILLREEALEYGGPVSHPHPGGRVWQ